MVTIKTYKLPFTNKNEPINIQNVWGKAVLELAMKNVDIKGMFFEFHYGEYVNPTVTRTKIVVCWGGRQDISRGIDKVFA